MTQINEPYYDTDPANKAYVDRVNGKTVAFVGTKSKNFGIRPEPPYHVNDTYMDGSDIYICIRDRELGSFDPSDWKLATAYTNNDVANSKNRVFITQPEPPYNKGDLWTTGPNGELRRCVNSRATGSYVESDWENATSYDSTHTVIENGLVTAGTIQVVNGGTVAAGITGNASGDNAIRFWAGATSGNKNNAPFRVTQGGKLYAKEADIEGAINATSGTIGGCEIIDGSLKIPSANIGSLSVDKITTGTNNQDVTFTNITSIGGKIGNWTISDHKIYGSYKLSSTDSSQRVAMMQMPEWDDDTGHHYGTWVFAAGGTNHDNYGDCPFRVSKYGELYASSGKIGGWTLSNSGLTGTDDDGATVTITPQGVTHKSNYEVATVSWKQLIMAVASSLNS